MSAKSQGIELQLFYSPLYPLETSNFDQQTSYGRVAALAKVAALAMDAGSVYIYSC